MRRLLYKSVLVLLVSSAVALGATVFYERKFGSVYRVYASPSKEYKLVVHRYMRPFTVPGDSSSDPGYVELLNSNGKRIARADLPTVLDLSLEENIHWRADGVTAPGMFAFSFGDDASRFPGKISR